MEACSAFASSPLLAVRDVDDQADRARGAPPLRSLGEEGLAAQQDPAGRAVEARDAVLVLVVAAAFRRERGLELVAERRAHVVRHDALEQVGVGVDVEIVRHPQQRAQLGRPVAPPRHPVDLVHAEPGRAPHQAQPLLGVAQRLLGGKLLGIRACGRAAAETFDKASQPAQQVGQPQPEIHCIHRFGPKRGKTGLVPDASSPCLPLSASASMLEIKQTAAERPSREGLP